MRSKPYASLIRLSHRSRQIELEIRPLRGHFGVSDGVPVRKSGGRVASRWSFDRQGGNASGDYGRWRDIF